MKLSQITTKDNIAFNSKTPQQKIMEELDEMCKQARKIKNRKKKQKSYGQKPGAPSSGHLDTQLFPPRSMKAEAQTKIKATLRNNLWTISDGVEEVTLSVEELFPSREYDVSQVKSGDFGVALALRLTNGKLEEEAKKLISENFQETYDISETEVEENKITEIVCDVIPLNDYQKNIRDALEAKFHGN